MHRMGGAVWAMGSLGLILLGCGDVGPQSEPDDPALGSVEASVQTCVTLIRNLAGGIVADTMIDPAAPDANYGGSTTLAVGPSCLGLAQFDLSSVPPGAIVTSALARFTESTSGAGTMNLYRALSPWAEGTVTWNSFQSAMDPVAASTRSNPSGVGMLGFLIASLVQQWLDGTYPNYGFALQQGSGTTTLYSSETTSALANRPQLILLVR